MFGFVELSWAYTGFRWVVFGPGLLRAYVYFILGLRWTILGCLGPMLPILGLCWAFLGSMLGHLGFVLAYLGAMLRRRGTM